MVATTARRYMRVFRELRSRAAAAAAPPDAYRNWQPTWFKAPGGIVAGIGGRRNRSGGGGNGGKWGSKRGEEKRRSPKPRTEDWETKERRRRE